jgi:hypothetical protein
MLCALLFAAVHSASAPSAVAQATPSPQIAYRTYIRPRFDAGELRIAVVNGYVIGTYRPDTGGTIARVAGGSQGSDIWLDIPTLGGIHIQGSVQSDGSITGLGTPLGPSAKQYVFTAKPEASPPPSP